MHHIDYGLGVLRRRRSPTSSTPTSAFDLAEVYQQLLAEDELAGFEVPDRFYEIGSPEGLEETRAHLAGRRRDIAS